MLRFDETRDDSRGMGVGLVVRHGRPAAVAGGDDAEPHVRQRRDGPGRAPDGHGGGAVQDHEGGRTALYRFRAVPGEVGEGDQVDGLADARGTP